MRWLKIGLYLFFILVLQTVIFARLNFFGVRPDLFLVSIIIFAVLDKSNRMLIFAAGLAFLQDLLSFGIYINTMLKVIIYVLVNAVKESFIGDEFSLVVGLVAVFTPLIFIIEGGVYFFFFGKQFNLLSLFLSMMIGTIYNLILVPVFFPLIRELMHD